MRRHLRRTSASVILTLAALSPGLAQEPRLSQEPSLAQQPDAPAPAEAPAPKPGRNIAPTGKTMPPAGGAAAAASAPTKASTEAEMLKAQRATAERDKAWDTKMRRTMGSICKGC